MRSQRGAALSVLLWLILAAAIGFLGWQGWRHIELAGQSRDQLATDLQELAGQYEELALQCEERDEVLAERLSSVDRLLDDQTRQFKALQEGGQQNWLMGEAESLASLAGQRLLLTADLVATRRLLESADAALSRISDPAVMPARRALAVDIEAVRGAEQIDIPAVVLRLAALQLLVAELAVPAAPVVIEPVRSLPESPTWWQRLLHSLPVRIQRDGDQSILPLDQQQAALLRLALDNSLQQAQLALLQARPAVYLAALEQADRLLVSRFPLADARVRQLRTALDELKTEAVHQALPDIGRGLAAIRDLKAGGSQ
ncbi:MAG: uroporphyrinogen-III C-methyltransferase [Alcanivoracaceae bacterium]